MLMPLCKAATYYFMKTVTSLRRFKSLELHWQETEWPCEVQYKQVDSPRDCPEPQRARRQRLIRQRPWRWRFAAMLFVLLTFCGVARAQMLVNVDFGVGRESLKIGPAAIGQSTNDFWNLYSHYEPK